MTLDEPHAVVLSYDYWRRRFAEDPGVLNQTLMINGQAMTIVGIAPKDFSGTSVGLAPQVFAPITMMRFAWPGFNNFENRKQYWACFSPASNRASRWSRRRLRSMARTTTSLMMLKRRFRR